MGLPAPELSVDGQHSLEVTAQPRGDSKLKGNVGQVEPPGCTYVGLHLGEVALHLNVVAARLGSLGDARVERVHRTRDGSGVGPAVLAWVEA